MPEPVSETPNYVDAGRGWVLKIASVLISHAFAFAQPDGSSGACCLSMHLKASVGKTGTPI